MDFDYKKYSLEQLKEWVDNAILSSEASPQEIYDVIKNAVDENYHYFKHHTGRCYDLLALLNGNGKGHISAYDEYVEKKENLICDKDNPSEECQKSWNSFWEESSDGKSYIKGWDEWEATHYPEEYKGSTVNSVKKDKVKKWVLPVEVDGPSAEYFVTFPDDLLEAANLKEGDQVEWVDQGDGSYLIKKVN